jgi:heme oxygenase (mycobilin-producing)
MAVQVLIRRKFVKEKAKAISPLLVELRSLAQTQQGYISSESLKCIDPPGEYEYLIRSTWNSLEQWKRWLNSEERAAIQRQIDVITGEETQYCVYEPLVGGIIPR